MSTSALHKMQVSSATTAPGSMSLISGTPFGDKGSRNPAAGGSEGTNGPFYCSTQSSADITGPITVTEGKMLSGSP